MEGWIKLHRKIINSKIWEKPHLWRNLWVWMILMASHQDGITPRGTFITTWQEIQRQMSYKQGYITKKPSIKSLQRIAARLDEWSMIVLTRVPNGIMIKVLNYGKYQGSENYECPDESPTSVPPNGTSIIKKKNDNKYIYRDGAEYDRIRPNTTGYEAIRSDTKHTDNDNDNDNDNKDTYISGRGKGRQSEIERIYSSYKSLINPNSRLTPASREKIRVRLKTYSVDELIKAMTNFSQDDWWMEHNASRGVAWFFHNDERIDQLLNLKPKRSTSAKWR